MSTRITKICAATAIVLSFGLIAGPAASAETPSEAATPATGSVFICVPLGSVVWCL